MPETHRTGVPVDDLSPSYRPQDDLYRYVNGNWIERTPIPDDKGAYGVAQILRDESEAAVRAIIEEASASPGDDEARKIGDLFASFMDEARIEELGAAPLAEDLALVDTVDSPTRLLEVLGHFGRAGIGGLFGLYVSSDLKDPDTYVVSVEQSGISLPNESYYRDEQFAEVRAAYRSHVARMLELAGVEHADERAGRVVDLETEIARHHWDNVATRERDKTYNPLPWDGLRELLGSGAAEGTEVVDLNVWARAFGAPEGALERVVVREPSFVSGVGALLVDERLDAWRDWLRWKVVHEYAPYLSSGFVAEHFDFYGRVLSGTPQIRERWKRGVSLVEGVLGEAIGKIYVRQHFAPSAKSRMDELVAHLIEAYRHSIESLEWMTPATRARALDKLSKFTPKIGYPEKWRDYSALEVSAQDLIANVRAANEFEFRRELAKIGSPVDRAEWMMYPQTVNAYYYPSFNEVVFPAGILQPPFFDESADGAANYGGIGAIIGHEIGHGFDDQGSKSDGEGRLVDWWEPVDHEAFVARTASLIDQYNALAPRQTPGHHVNGALTVGENIGDLGGLSIAWKAYLLSLKGAEPPVIDGLSAAQRFLISWAQSWRLSARDEEVIRRLTIDPHSPDEFRCNQIVRNLDLFYDAFGVTDADELWLDPEERVSIW